MYVNDLVEFIGTGYLILSISQETWAIGIIFFCYFMIQISTRCEWWIKKVDAGENKQQTTSN